MQCDEKAISDDLSGVSKRCDAMDQTKIPTQTVKNLQWRGRFIGHFIFSHLFRTKDTKNSKIMTSKTLLKTCVHVRGVCSL